MRTLLGRSALGAAVTVLLLALVALPASGHDVLSGSDPADGSRVAGPPERVTLTFNEAPNPASAVLTVVGPDGTRREVGPTTTEGNRVSVALGRLGPVGVYEVGYRVLSSDGHPIAGSTTFRLATAVAPGPSGVVPAAPPAAAESPAGTTTSDAVQAQAQAEPASAEQPVGGLPAWPFVILALLVIAGAVTFVLRRNAS